MEVCGPVSAACAPHCEKVGAARLRHLLETRCRLNKFDGRSNIAYAPSGHRIGLGKTVERNRAIRHARHCANAHMLPTVIDELFVNLVRNHNQVVSPVQLRAMRSMIFASDNSGGWISRRYDQNSLWCAE